MSSPSRDGSRDRAESRLVRHQHSFSESGRSSIPMWDSSDPDRAPPPLPLNPGASHNSPITKPYVSATIEKAAALIASRAIENTPSAYTSNPPPPSPDKNLIKPHHRRMQTIQTGSVGRLSDSLERRSPDKGLSRSKLSDFDEYRPGRSLDRSPTRSGSETPTPAGRGTPGSKSLSDENTPPSSNMLALQSFRNRQEADLPFIDITNAGPTLKSAMSLESLSSQILNITSIATSLQREMTNLSRRSKDNATDLVSLKEATNLRDEDIRKSLKDLRVSIDNKFTSIDARMLGANEASRSTPNLGLYLDEKLHDTPTRKTFTLPRIASPSLLDRDITASPSVVSVDGAASIALLEKVLREMATKDGQDKLITTFESAKFQAQKDSSQALARGQQPTIDPKMMQKLEEILVFMKNIREDSGSKALIKSAGTDGSRSPSQIDIYLDGEGKAGPVSKIRKDEDKQSSNMSSISSEVVNEEVMKILKSVKQSLSQNGGLTNEVKTLVRELRGEVLGMGREIAKKLEEADVKNASLDKDATTPSEEVTRIVDQGIAELKEHLHHMVQENHRLATELAKPTVNTQEIVMAVQNVVAELPRANSEPARDLAAEREDMLLAIKEAWEDCKPEIALEHFGLERDEILETLKEGLQSYQPQQIQTDRIGASYDQVLDAVQRGLADFKPPEIQVEPAPTREEIFSTVRECLDNYEFPSAAAPSQIGSDLTRDDVLDAVKEVLSLQVGHPRAPELTKDDVLEAVRDGVAAQGHHTKEVEFDRRDIFDAIRACLEGEQNPLGAMGERVVEAMHEFLGSMKVEFQQYSAANGRDTEQVLDALKDGLEELRAEIESYVDRAADVTGKDEIIDTVKAGFAAMQADMDKGFANRVQQAPNTPELLDAMEKEFEHLRDTISKSLIQGSTSSDKNEILDAIRDINDDRQSSLSSNSDDIARQVKEELEHMRKTLAGTLIKSGASVDRDEVLDAIREGLEMHRSMPKVDGNESILSNTSELLDAFQDGVDGIRADMQKLTDKQGDLSINYEILDTLKAGIEEVRLGLHKLHEKQSDDAYNETARGQEITLHQENNIHAEIESLKVMITQLRVKVESLDNLPVPEPVMPTEMRVHKDDLEDIHAAIREIHGSVQDKPDHVLREDMDVVHAAIREVHDSVQKVQIHVPEVTLPQNAASKEDIEAIETLLRNVKAQLDDLVIPDLSDSVKVSHIDSIEDLLKNIKSSVEASTAKSPDSGSSEDFTVIGLLLKDVQVAIEDLPGKINGLSDDEKRLTKTDLEVLETICLDTKEKLEGFTLPDVEYLATKDDVDEMKESIKAFREQLEADNDLTAQAFEARKIEHGGLATKIDDIKSIIGEVREELIGKLNGSEEGLVELAKVLGMHHDNMSIYATATSITELSELVTKGFDAYIDHHAANKTEMEERDATMFSKHEETTAELKSKLEDRFNELMLKYDDAQLSNEKKLNELEGRDASLVEATTSVKTVVDDMKGLVDTLGVTVSEACERMSNDAKTIFEKVDQSNMKIDDLHSTNAEGHGLTREEVAKTLATAARLEESIGEHQPAIMAAIKEVLGVIGQQYDHTQQQGESIKEVLGIIGQHYEHSQQQDESIKEILGIIGQHYEYSQQQGESLRAAAEEIKSNVSAIPSAIPSLLPALEAPREAPSEIDTSASRQFDDSEIRAKLDELLDHASIARDAFDNLDHHHKNTQASLIGLESLEKLEKLEKLERLDSIHEQVRGAAQEISALLTTHTKLITSHHESKAEEAREAAIALEKRTAQKSRVEAEIIALNQEKDALAASMAALRREHEELSGQTKKLTREVAKLETALNIRQEEMRDMNARAESLERRVLEGVMNHARSLKFAKPQPKKKISPTERDASMNLKRVVSTSSNTTAKASSVGNASSTFGSTVGMALKKRNGLPTAAKPRQSTKGSNIDRRILSTSNVTGNRVSDAHRALVLAPVSNTGLVSLKRSHSVKSNPSSYLNGRKPSWNGVESYEASKENEALHEEDETQQHADDDLSDTGTERRSSYTGTYSDSMTYGTGSAVSRNSMRSASYASSVGGTLNGQTESIEEEAEGEHDEQSCYDDETDDYADVKHKGQHAQLTVTDGSEAFDEVGDLPGHGEMLRYKPKYAAPSDSGIGTEPLTPDVSTDGSQAWRSTVST